MSDVMLLMQQQQVLGDPGLQGDSTAAQLDACFLARADTARSAVEACQPHQQQLQLLVSPGLMGASSPDVCTPPPAPAAAGRTPRHEQLQSAAAGAQSNHSMPDWVAGPALDAVRPGLQSLSVGLLRASSSFDVGAYEAAAEAAEAAAAAAAAAAVQGPPRPALVSCSSIGGSTAATSDALPYAFCGGSGAGSSGIFGSLSPGGSSNHAGPPVVMPPAASVKLEAPGWPSHRSPHSPDDCSGSAAAGPGLGCQSGLHACGSGTASASVLAGAAQEHSSSVFSAGPLSIAPGGPGCLPGSMLDHPEATEAFAECAAELTQAGVTGHRGPSSCCGPDQAAAVPPGLAAGYHHSGSGSSYHRMYPSECGHSAGFDPAAAAAAAAAGIHGNVHGGAMFSGAAGYDPAGYLYGSCSSYQPQQAHQFQRTHSAHMAAAAAAAIAAAAAGSVVEPAVAFDAADIGAANVPAPAAAVSRPSAATRKRCSDLSSSPSIGHGSNKRSCKDRERERARDKRRNEQVETLEQQLADAVSTKAAMRIRLDAMTRDKAQLLAKITELTSRYKAAVAENAALSVQNLTLQRQAGTSAGAPVGAAGAGAGSACGLSYGPAAGMQQQQASADYGQLPHHAAAAVGLQFTHSHQHQGHQQQHHYDGAGPAHMPHAHPDGRPSDGLQSSGSGSSSHQQYCQRAQWAGHHQHMQAAQQYAGHGMQQPAGHQMPSGWC